MAADTVSEGDWNAANAAYWSAAAAEWRALGLAPREAVRDLTRRLGCAPGSLLLDAGCGSGNWSIALALAGFRVRGVDLAPEMIAQAQENARAHGLALEQASFQVGDVARLPFADATFDGVVCRAVLDFTPAPGDTLIELWRALKPRRRLALSMLGARSPVKRDLWRRFLPGAELAVRMNGILPWEAEALLGELGWRIVEQYPSFGPAASGASNPYTEEMSKRLGDRTLQQTVASAWMFIVERPPT